jgi:hypothetical protein
MSSIIQQKNRVFRSEKYFTFCQVYYLYDARCNEINSILFLRTRSIQSNEYTIDVLVIDNMENLLEIRNLLFLLSQTMNIPFLNYE